MQDGIYVFQDEIIVNILCLLLLLILTLTDAGLFLLNQWKEDSETIQRYQTEQAEFQFHMLRNQLNPHFLFNSLNTLSSLIQIDPGQSRLFIRKLSSLYRNLLRSGGEDILSIREELAIAEDFIYLIQLRFQNKLEVKMDIPEEFQDKQVIRLTLQMLIENAVKHNEVSTRNPLLVEIFAEGDYFVVKNKILLKDQKEESSGLGLHNIRNRYEVLSDKSLLVEEEDGYFQVKVPILNPQQRLS